jgi:hypothetical protein
MNGPHPRLFESLEPPRDGLARLRTRLEQDQRRTRLLRAAYGGAAALLLGLAGWIALGPATTERYGGPEDPYRLARIGLGLEPVPEEQLTIHPEDRHRAAAGRVPLSDERVVLYLVATVDPER